MTGDLTETAVNMIAMTSAGGATEVVVPVGFGMALSVIGK